MSKLVSVPISRLKAGMTCSQPILSDEGVLLIGGGTRITEPLLSAIRDRDIRSISIDPRDLLTLQPEKRSLRKLRLEQSDIDLLSGSTPLKSLLFDRFKEDLSEERAELLTLKLDNATRSLAALDRKLQLDALDSAIDLLDLSEDYARTMIDDHDQTVGMIGALVAKEGSSHHSNASQRCVRLAVLGMSVAIEMGFDGPQTLEVGLTGLLHDVGFKKMALSAGSTVADYKPESEWDFQKHPLISARCLQETDVTESVVLAIQQVHEQFDGSGYPRAIKGARIHPYARILNVADAFLHLTSGVDDRPGIVPHDAVGFLLHQAAKGVFDPQVVKAFLQSETLFPLGSLVELSNGDISTVIRRPRSGYATPVLQDSTGNRVDLSESKLRVVRPVGSPGANQTRMTAEMMQTLTWNPAQTLASA